MRKNATTAKRLAIGSKGMMNLNVGTSRRMKQKQRFKPSRRGVSVQSRGARRPKVRRNPSQLVLLLTKDQPPWLWLANTVAQLNVCQGAHGQVERILLKGITGDTVNAERADVVFPVTTIEGKRYAIFMRNQTLVVDKETETLLSVAVLLKPASIS
jgi:hypothetical protein